MKLTGKIGVFTLTMMTAAIVIAVRNLPTMAETGFHVIFFTLLAGVGFLLPIALVSAELATGWPERGGVYIWIREAFGEKWGFLGIWLQWMQNIVWFPTTLSFLASSFAYLFAPSLATNPFYLMVVILTVYWGTVYMSLKGLKVSGLISTVGVIGGIFLPLLLIILLGGLYIFFDDPIHLDLSWKVKDFIPDLTKAANLSILIGFFYAFTGMEVTAVHAKDVDNPKKTYPIALFLVAFLVIILNVIGALSIAIVVPSEEISLVAGVMDAFGVFLNSFHIKWLLPVLALLVTLGALGQVSSWVIGPSRGLLETAKQGNLPPFFQKMNKKRMPKNILVLQATIISVLCLLFFFLPNVNSFYWILLTLASLLYLMMYVLVFAAAIRLRYSHPHVRRSFTIPGGRIGMNIVSGIGIFFSLFTMVVAFSSPSQVEVGSETFYVIFLILGILLFVGTPLWIYRYKHESWKLEDK